MRQLHMLILVIYWTGI